MFRHRPTTIPQAGPTPAEPILGLFFSADQSSLNFGSDRKISVPSRPVLAKRQEQALMIVLPVTSRTPKRRNLHQFYTLNPSKKEVIWNHHESRISYVYYMYETLHSEDLKQKIGILPQEQRVNIARWHAQFNLQDACS